MNLLNKLTIKNLKLNKKRTIVTIIGIILSIALMTAVASIYSSTLKSLIRFETSEKGNFHLALYDYEANDLKKLEENRNIENINKVVNYGYAKVDSKNDYKPYVYIKGFTTESLNELSVQIVEGRLPENTSEILIPTHLKTNGRISYKVGDEITLEVGNRLSLDGYELNQFNPYQLDEDNKSLESIKNTTTKTYKIVGVMERPASNVEPYDAPGYTLITKVNDLNEKDKLDVYIRFTKKGVKDLYNTLGGILNVDGNLIEKADEGRLTEEEENEYDKQLSEVQYKFSLNDYLIGLEKDPIKGSGLQGLGVVVLIVLGIIVFASVFCIKNSFDISITEKIKQYGMLRSVGATKKQIKKNVFYEATILGIIGIPLGLLLGILATFILVIVSNYYMNGGLTEGLYLVFDCSIYALLIASLLGIITVYLSALRSARKASKVSPIESVRNSADIKIKSKKIKSNFIINKLFGIGGVISYKNLKRNKKKYRTTVISIVISVAIFIALSGFMNLAFDEVKQVVQVQDFNLYVSLNNESDETIKKVDDIVTSDGIKNYAVIKYEFININRDHLNQEVLKFYGNEVDDINEDTISIVALGEEQYKKYVESLGRKNDELKDKVILMDTIMHVKYENNKLVKYLDRQYTYNNGDFIEGIINNDNQSLEIGYITDQRPFGMKYNENPLLIVSEELFSKLCKKVYKIEIPIDAENPDRLQDNLEKLLDGEKYYIDNINESVKTMNNLFTLVGIFLYGFIIVISLIGITNIFNTITTNMELRKPEFAMLKSVGMTTKEFNRMIRLETIFMGIKSLVFGIPIGIVLSYFIYNALSEDTGIPYKVPVLAIIISVLAVFILISLIMKYSINKIKKQNTIETIRNENI